MKDKKRGDQRSRVGYGSSYRKGSGSETDTTHEIKAVLGGQVWMVKPDRSAKAENPCIWMQAGVAKFKNCNNFYDCTTCKYDSGMKNKVSEGRHMSWQDAMRRKSDKDRICRHSLTHRIGGRICAYNYKCSKCDFDQFFEEVWTIKTKSIPSEVQEVKGFDVPMDYFFHNGHTWARIESGGYLRVGFDDFSLKLLGKPDALDLPLMGKELDVNSVGWGLRRKDNQADVLSPIDGVIMEVNPRVRENPELANREPYGEGWLFMVHSPDIKRAAKKLMTEKTSLNWMNDEVNKLENMIEAVSGPLTADGGLLQHDIYGNLPGLEWKDLTKTFLKT